MPDKPYLFLDWDGVGNTVQVTEDTGHDYEALGYKIRVPKSFPANIERLMEKFDMVWLTTWEHSANEHFSTFFGWDEWPVVPWASWEYYDGDHGTCKLGALPQWLSENGGPRPFVFIDDAAAHEPQWAVDNVAALGEPFKIIMPHLYTGMTTEQTDEALAWAEENVQ